MSRAELMPDLLRRLIAPVVVLALAVVGIASASIHFGGEDARLTRQVNRELRAVRELRRQIDRLESSRTFVVEKLPIFEAARDKGFLGTPDELAASVLVEELATKHQLNDATYSFEPARRVPIGEPGDEFAANFVALPMRLRLQALFDEDLFLFLNAFARQLDGYAVVRGMRIRRTQGDIDAVVSRVRRGERPSVISATVDIDWVSLEPLEPWPGMAASEADETAGTSPTERTDPLAPAFAADTLFLGTTEAQAIRDALHVAESGGAERGEDTPPEDADAASPQADAAPPPPPLLPVYLAALFYLGPERWSFWLDGERFVPGRTQADFEVVRVTPDGVTLNWTPSDRDASFTFTLRPRQSFDPRTGEVIEGRPLAEAAGEGAGDG